MSLDDLVSSVGTRGPLGANQEIDSLKGFSFNFTDKDNNKIGYVHVTPPDDGTPGVVTVELADKSKQQQAAAECKTLGELLHKPVTEGPDGKITFTEVSPEFASIVVKGLEQRGVVAQGAADNFHTQLLQALDERGYTQSPKGLKEAEKGQSLLDFYQQSANGVTGPPAPERDDKDKPAEAVGAAPAQASAAKARKPVRDHVAGDEDTPKEAQAPASTTPSLKDFMAGADTPNPAQDAQAEAARQEQLRQEQARAEQLRAEQERQQRIAHGAGSLDDLPHDLRHIMTHAAAAAVHKIKGMVHHDHHHKPSENAKDEQPHVVKPVVASVKEQGAHGIG